MFACLTRGIYYLDGGIVDDYLMEARSNDTPGYVFQLFTCLHEKVPARWWKFDGDALSRVASPYVEAGVTRTAVDG